jgi:uncharacterized protein (DUF849 family)
LSKGVLADNKQLVSRAVGVAKSLSLALADVKATEQRLALPAQHSIKLSA